MHRLLNHMTVLCLFCMVFLNACQPNHKDTTEVFDDLLISIIQDEMIHSPELRSKLDQQKISFAISSNHQLTDRSFASMSKMQVTRLEKLHSLSAINPAHLPPDQRNSHAVLSHLLKASTDFSNYQFGHTDLFSNRPYIITHLDGAYLEIPAFLAHHHPINDLRDAQEYVERLSQVSQAIDDEVSHFIADKKNGIIPSSFILDKIIANAQAIYDQSPDQSPFTTTLQYGLEYLENLDIQSGQSLLNQAHSILKNDIRPAYLRLIETMEASKTDTPTFHGVSVIPNGAEYYQTILDGFSLSPQTPEDLHQLGLDLVSDISAQLDLMLSEQNLSENSVGIRLTELSANTEYLYEDSLEGRNQLLADVQNHIALMDPIVANTFNIGALPPLLVQQTPEKSAYLALGSFYDAGPLGQFQIANFYINLQSIVDWPSWTLKTLSFHETIPGHHLQQAIQRRTDLPLVQRIAHFPAFIEGWGVYAEDLADETGIYADDPLSRIGYLQSLLFRSARLVVDTGIHSQSWTRDQAVQYLVDTTGYSNSAMQDEVDRYSVWPGQACVYMVGRNEFRAMRDEADLKLGNAFNLKEFHTVILDAGARPLALVKQDVTKWLEQKTEEKSVAK